MHARVIAVVVAIVGVLAAMVAVPASARTEAASGSPAVVFSADGQTWGATLPAPLFDERALWVPGDSRTATFFVRNDSGEGAHMHVDVVSSSVDGLIRVGDLTVEARADGEGWRSTSEPGVQQLSSTSIAPGQVRTIDVRVSLPWSTTNSSQTLSLMFDLRVTLSDPDTASPVAPNAPDAGRGGASGGDGLSVTGGAVPLVLVVSACGLLIAGVVLARSRVTRSGRDEESS